MPQPLLKTERLDLVPLAPEHLHYDVLLESDPEVMRYLGGPRTSVAAIRRAQARRLAMSQKIDGLGCWMAFAANREDPDRDEMASVAGGPFVGLMMLPPAHGPDQPDDPGVADLGYRLARHAWGRGYGLEAARRLLDHAFDAMHLDRVIAQTRVDNEPSRRLLTAAGLHYVRTFRSRDANTADPLDVEYSVTRCDYGAQRSQGSS